jgi:hypothetical protein
MDNNNKAPPRDQLAQSDDAQSADVPAAAVKDRTRADTVCAALPAS